MMLRETVPWEREVVMCDDDDTMEESVVGNDGAVGESVVSNDGSHLGITR
jgi:hypothetical protein